MFFEDPLGFVEYVSIKKAEPAQTGSTVRLLVYQKRGIGSFKLKLSRFGAFASNAAHTTTFTQNLLYISKKVLHMS